MSERPGWTVLLLAGALCAACPAPGQQATPQIDVIAVVHNVYPQPPEPVKGVRVTLTYLDSAVLVTDTQYRTNSQGEAQLQVSPDVARRSDLRIEIKGSDNLAIYEPEDGQLSGLASPIKISLLPKGSFRLMSEKEIRARLNRAMVEVSNLQKENREIRAQQAAQQGGAPDHLAAAISEWSRESGLSETEIEKDVKTWAENILEGNKPPAGNEKALAELALGHYDAATELFNHTYTDQLSAFKERQRQEREGDLKAFQQCIESAYRAANSSWMGNNYRQATSILEAALDEAAEQHRQAPEDTAYRALWLEVLGRTADAREEEAVGGAAADNAQLLTQAIQDYRTLIDQYSDAGEREQWARVENSLGNALTDQAMRSSGADATGLLAHAIDAYNKALNVQTKATLPGDWARTEDNLGVSLWRQGEGGEGAQSMDFLKQAAMAFRAALDVETRGAMPADWAMTKNNLGLVLTDQAARSSGAQARTYLAEAAAVLNEALQVFTRKDYPPDWAMAQGNLGVALRNQGERSSGVQANDLLAKAVQAFRASLEVRTREKGDQDWAREQNNLCLALRVQGEHSSGAQAIKLFTQAVDACNLALEVRKPDKMPMAFAWTNNNLGNALLDLAEHSTGLQAKTLIAQAADAQNAALNVFTKTDRPQDWAASQDYLGNALFDEGTWSSGETAANFFAQAREAYNNALDEQQHLPQAWAETQYDLANALRVNGEHSSGAEATALFAQAAEANESALTVFSKTDLPYQWVKAEINLARTLADQGDSSGAAKALEECLDAFPTDAKVIQRAAFVYHDRLYQYGRSLALSERWVKSDASSDARLSLVEDELTAGQFEDCGKQAATISDASFAAPALPMILIRDAMKMACQWGAGDKAAARQTAKTLLPKAGSMERTGWDFQGTLHFLESSPAFKTGRASWIGLFQSLANGDGPGMASAFEQLQRVIGR